MFRMPEDDEIGALLQQGLRRVPVPEPAADFDARVRARLRRASPWQLFWNAARPALVPAACSLTVTLALLNGVGIPQAGSIGPGSQAARNGTLKPGSNHVRSVEEALDRIDREPPTLTGFGLLRRSDRAHDSRSRPDSHRGASGRHVERPAWMQG